MTRPNIVMILTDDQAWGDLSATGNTNLNTPNVDSLAAQGATFDHFYVCPVCSPTRAELLTGRYHTRLGVTSTSSGGERLNLDEITLGETFKAAGYATAAFGKWHNGLQWPYHPNARGFDEFYGFCSGHWGHYFSPMLEHNGELVRGDGYIIDDLTNHALEFIEENKEQPFFCYLPYNIPHSPMQMPEEYWQRFANADLKMRHREPAKEDLEYTRAALAMCENIDWNVGRVLGRLDALGLADNTIVIYFSDNGPNNWRWNGGMKGKKGNTDEGGVRSPFFIRWPEAIAPGTSIPQIAGDIDLLPTLADLCGVPLISDKPLDGVSLKPLLLDPAADWPDRFYFNTWMGRVSVRTQQFRLDDQGRLFDMVKDPGQYYNVADKHPDVARRLRKAAQNWIKETMPPEPPDRPFPVGHPAVAGTWLPSRDAEPSGNIVRSNRFPNDSFFTHWTSPGDSISWDVEVLTPGKYDARVYYTCKPENLGAEIELSYGDSKIRARVTEAFDPPLVGKADDRVPREMSYVKDFKPMTLGTLDLGKRRGSLTLRATDIPGDEAIDVRYIELTRQSE